MNSIENRHFNLNRTLLLTIGLWPYKKSKFSQFHLICFFGILLSRIVFQLIILITSKRSVDVIIEILSPTFNCMIFLIKYNSFYVNGQTVKYLLEQLQRTYDDLKDNNEIAIIEKYGNDAKRSTAFLTMIVIIIISILMLILVSPGFLDVFLPMNKSWSHRLKIMVQHSVIKERYFYLQLLHINVSISIGILTLLATGMILYALLYHACGMFKIARFSERLISDFEITYVFIILFGVIAVSFDTFQIFQILSSTYDIAEFTIPFLNACGFLIYMFMSNLIGQKIMDHSNCVYATAYKVRWYIAPLHTQRLILFLLQRGSKIFKLHIGGLYVASLEYMTMLLKAIMSYVTVMCSTR